MRPRRWAEEFRQRGVGGEGSGALRGAGALPPRPLRERIVRPAERVSAKLWPHLVRGLCRTGVPLTKPPPQRFAAPDDRKRSPGAHRALLSSPARGDVGASSLRFTPICNTPVTLPRPRRHPPETHAPHPAMSGSPPPLGD